MSELFRSERRNGCWPIALHFYHVTLNKKASPGPLVLDNRSEIHLKWNPS